MTAQQERAWFWRMMIVGLVAFWTAVVLLLSGCGDTGDTYLRWEKRVSELSGVPIYSDTTDTERCLLQAVLNAYEQRYGTGAIERVNSIWLVRDIEQEIPCMSLQYGEACTWAEVWPAYSGVADPHGLGAGGFMYPPGHVFVAIYGSYKKYLALVFMHELGHAALGMSHNTIADGNAWSDWEQDMWFDYTWPHLQAKCPDVGRLDGTAWYLFPWGDG